jgi:ketosteroid isomerase-like protein
VTSIDISNVERARRYLAAIEASTMPGAGDAAVETLLEFFHAGAEVHEFPNRLVPSGAIHDRDAIRRGIIRGRSAVESQRYEVKADYACGDIVVLEVLWIGRLAVPLGKVGVGEQLRAHFALFLEFRDGRIWRQRNYDCFEPF